MRALAAVALAACLGLAYHLATASGQGLIVAQSVERTQAVDRAVVEQLPAVEQLVSFQTGHGGERATYTGALLWSLMQRAGALGSEPEVRLRRTVAVTGRDGYVAVLALAEIDPEFEGKSVILAYRREGQRLPENELRLVVPGDRRGGRSVRDVVRIDVR